jgi:glycosyltransferase involved in cell wall biosynthesis
MIACIAKNARARPLFQSLARIDPRFTHVGDASISRGALIRGAVASIGPNLQEVKMEARKGAAAAASLQADCVRLIDSLPDQPEAVLYWGATNWPLDPARHRMPYYLITDGPYDPNDPSYPPEWIPRKWKRGYFELQRDVYRGATKIFTLSEWARQKLLDVHGLPEDRVVRIGWGPLASVGDPLFGLPSGSRYFISVGNQWGLKNMELIARAATRIHAEDPSVQTILIGKPGGAEVAPRPGVILMPHEVPGYVVQQLIRGAVSLIVASSFDASPHVIPEALQYGTPVIGTRVCGILDAIEAPEGGTVIECPDESLLEEAMRRHLAAPTSARKGAHDLFLRTGGWEAAARKLADRLLA